jgi:molybdate transport system regulatory protein
MSYRRAWLLVDVMNRCWAEPLVSTAAGGSHGGGARVTEAGQAVLAAYRGLEAQLAEVSQGSEEYALLTKAMRAD